MTAWNKIDTWIGAAELEDAAAGLKGQGYRLVQIGCVKEPAGDCPAETLELIYSFDRDYELRNLRLILKPEAAVPSVTASYGCAFLYENEIHDLFGLNITGINVDFGGTLYKVAKPRAFNPAAQQGGAA